MSCARTFTLMTKPTNMIYFITDGNNVKIGVSRDISKRMKTLQAYSANRLSLIASCFGGFDLESSLHKKFSHLRIKGEWFFLTPELKDFSERLGIEKRDVCHVVVEVDIMRYSSIPLRAHKARISMSSLCKRAGKHRQAWSRAMKRGRADYTLIDPIERALTAIEAERDAPLPASEARAL